MKSPALTWDELATIYDKNTNKKARTQPMNTVFDWAVGRKDIFVMCPKEKTLHLKEKEE